MKDRNHTDAVRRIQADQAFTLAGVLIDAEHLAAYLDSPRRRILRDIFHPPGRDGVPYVQIGYRQVCTIKHLEAYLARQAKPQKTSKRRKAKGGVE